MEVKMEKNQISNVDNKTVIEEIRSLLMDCVSMYNCRRAHIIKKNLVKIEGYKNKISLEQYDALEQFITDAIRPLIYDPYYWEFLLDEKWMRVDKRGHRRVKSDEALDEIVDCLETHLHGLERKIDEFILHSFYQNNR